MTSLRCLRRRREPAQFAGQNADFCGIRKAGGPLAMPPPAPIRPPPPTAPARSWDEIEGIGQLERALGVGAALLAVEIALLVADIRDDQVTAGLDFFPFTALER